MSQIPRLGDAKMVDFTVLGWDGARYVKWLSSLPIALQSQLASLLPTVETLDTIQNHSRRLLTTREDMLAARLLNRKPTEIYYGSPQVCRDVCVSNLSHRMPSDPFSASMPPVLLQSFLTSDGNAPRALTRWRSLRYLRAALAGGCAQTAYTSLSTESTCVDWSADSRAAVGSANAYVFHDYLAGLARPCQPAARGHRARRQHCSERKRLADTSFEALVRRDMPMEKLEALTGLQIGPHKRLMRAGVFYQVHVPSALCLVWLIRLSSEVPVALVAHVALGAHVALVAIVAHVAPVAPFTHLTISYLIPSPPIPSHPILPHPAPSHPIPSHPMQGVPPNRLNVTPTLGSHQCPGGRLKAVDSRVTCACGSAAPFQIRLAPQCEYSRVAERQRRLPNTECAWDLHFCSAGR